MKDYKAIEIKDLVIDYGNSVAVKKINLDIKKGDLVTLLGPSGCGKSTTLNALAGLITTTSGKIYFNGKNVTKLSPKERDIGLVFQSYALYPHMTVYRNISFPLLANNKFKKYIEEKNKKYDIEILKYKYELSGKTNFESLYNIYVNYNNQINKFDEDIKNVKFKSKNDINNIKDLSSQLKTKRNSRIKDSAEKTLVMISDNDKNIEEIKKQAKILKESSISNNEKEKNISLLREKITKLEDLNKKAYDNHKEKIIVIKNEHKKQISESKSKKTSTINELKIWEKGTIEKISKEKNDFIIREKQSAVNSLEEIKNIVSKSILNDEDKKQIEKINKKKISWKYALDKKVKEVAERVGITDQLNKKVTSLSGGQQQRVAISRTLVKSPKVLLLDEPLSNLDAKMRVQTREWIRNLQQELGITTIFVTHDQEEAMSISDKIVCMSNGLIQQVDEPMNMYHNPINKFVAGFLGMPQMNFFDKSTKIGAQLFKKFKIDNANTFGIRPEHIKEKNEVSKQKMHSMKLKGIVQIIESFGREKLVTANVDNEIVKFFTENILLNRGDDVEIMFKREKIYIFDNVDLGNTIDRK